VGRVFLVTMLWSFAPNSGHAQSAMGIAAVVNDDVISLLDLNSRMQLVALSSRLALSGPAAQRLRQQVLRNLIDETLQLQEAKRLEIEVSKDQIDAAVKQIERQNNMPEGNIERLLARAGIGRESLENQLRAEISWSQIVRRSVLSSVTITDVQVDEAIAKIEEGKGKPEYLLAEIYLPFDIAESREDLLKAAQSLTIQIKRGADFATLAKTFSQSASAVNGGDLGWVRADQMDGNILAAVSRAQDRRLVGPVEAADGYYIVLRRSSRISQGVNVQNTIVDLWQLFLPATQNTADANMEAQLTKAKRISASARSCEEMKRLGTEVNAPQSGPLNNVSLSNLTPQLGGVVGSLAIGQASQPIALNGGIAVLMVCDKREEAVSSNIRADVRERLTQERAELVARRLMRNLRRSAFIDLRL